MRLEELLDELLVAITERDKKRIADLFKVAEEKGYTTRQEFIDMSDLVPEKIRSELNIATVCKFSLNGEEFVTALLPEEIKRISMDLESGVPREHILKALRVKASLGGKYLYSRGCA